MWLGLLRALVGHDLSLLVRLQLKRAELNLLRLETVSHRSLDRLTEHLSYGLPYHDLALAVRELRLHSGLLRTALVLRAS